MVRTIVVCCYLVGRWRTSVTSGFFYNRKFFENSIPGTVYFLFDLQNSFKHFQKDRY